MLVAEHVPVLLSLQEVVALAWLLLLVLHAWQALLAVALHILRRLALQNLAAEIVMHDQDGKALHILQLVATCLRILKDTADVGVAISEESLATRLLLVKHLDISRWQLFASLRMLHLQLTILLNDSHFQFIRVVGKELLEVARCDLHDHVAVLHLFGQRDA